MDYIQIDENEPTEQFPQTQGMAPFDPSLFRQSDNVINVDAGQEVPLGDIAPLPNEPLDPEIARDLDAIERRSSEALTKRILDEMRGSEPTPMPKKKPKKKR